MALSSVSTTDEIIAEYKDCAGYEFAGNSGSVSLAQRFAIACRLLILVMPKVGAQDRVNLSLSPELINTQLEDARRFIALAGGQDVVHFSFQNLRGIGTTTGTGGL